MTKYRLLAGTAIVAATAMTGSQAMAFDEVNWSWDLDVDTDITQVITTTTDISPSGLAAIEDIQIFIGDLSASSSVTGVSNNQPANGPVPTEVSEEFTLSIEGDATADSDNGSGTLSGSFSADVQPDGGGTPLATVGGAIDSSGNFPLNGSIGDSANFTVTIDVPQGGEAFDAVTDLPEVVSAAAAIANNISIETEVKTDLHETQILFDADEESSGSYTVETTSTDTTTTTSSASSNSASTSTTTTEAASESWEFFIGGTLAVDKTLDHSATVALDESLSAEFDKSVSASAETDVFYSGDFSASASGSASASAGLEQNVEVGKGENEIVDFDLDLDKSENYNWFADASGSFDGSGTVESEASADASGSLDITKDVDLSHTKTAALDLDVSGSYSAEAASSFETSSTSASSSSSSFETETTTTSSVDTKSVTTNGDLYALDTAFGVWNDLLDDGVNTGLATTLSMMVAAAYGGLEKSQVTATSFVDDISNASVDSSALAVGNNKNVTLNAATADDAVLIADINQFAYADVMASSTVSNVTVSNYQNLGVIPLPGSEDYRPLVDSTATAIGNNLSITVDSPLSPAED